MSTNQTAPVAPWVRWVTVGAVALVALVAAVVSYVHVRTLAEQAGEEWRKYLLPLSVDGLLVAASMVMLVRRREGLPAGWLPWTGLGLGLGASLAANVAAGHPEWRSPWLDGVVAAWPAVALAVSFELLILVMRGYQPAAEVQAERSEPAVGDEAAPAPAEAQPVEPARAPTKPVRTEAQKKAAAERTARSRRHKAGDHTMCDPRRCADAPRVRVAS